MKKLTMIITMSMLLLTQSMASIQIAPDKKKHIAAGLAVYGVCLTGGMILKSIGYDKNILTPVNCLAPVVLAGASKEIYDYNNQDKHTPEFADFTYTIAAPVLMSFVITRF